MSWYDSTILSLTRVAAGAPPKPSFSCAKASTPTEKTRIAHAGGL